MVNCAKCQKDKKAQFIADTGASNPFTFDKNDFVTFVEDSGTIQTADKKQYYKYKDMVQSSSNTIS